MKNWENRPWGRFRTLEEGKTHKWKILEIYPGKRFSLQYHSHRNEYWVVQKGRGKFKVGELNFILNAGTAEVIFIGKKEIHRAENIGKEVLQILELQTGKCQESDIKRIKDDYGRK